MNRYWIPGPITVYGTTERGFYGEVQVVLAADAERLQAVIDARDKAAGFDEVPALSPEARQAFRAAVQEVDGINLRSIDTLRKLLRDLNVFADHRADCTSHELGRGSDCSCGYFAIVERIRAALCATVRDNEVQK